MFRNTTALLAIISLLPFSSLHAQSRSAGAPSNIDFPEVQSHREGQVERERPKEGSITFRTTTDLVTVDVIATDRDGKPVNDLKPEDLRVQEDGKKRPIQALSLEHRGDSDLPVLAKLRNLTKEKPDKVFTNFSGAEETVPPNGCTVLLVDALNTPLASQAYARNQLLKMLEEMDPSRPVAIYALADTLRLVQPFTADQAKLHAAVANLGVRLAHGQPSGSQTGDLPLGSVSAIYTRGADGSMSASAQRMESDARYWDAEMSAQYVEQRVDRTLTALSILGRQIEGYSGRKNLIWISGAFPFTVLADPYGTFPSGTPRAYAAGITDVSRLLANANVAVYPIDANGLGTDSPDASNPLDGNGSSARPYTERAVSASLRRSSGEIVAAQQSMRQIAEETGGRAFYNRNDIAVAVRNAIHDGDTFYSLAFPPQSKVPDGSLHTIQISTSRKGVNLRYRKGYYALDAAQRDELHAKTEMQQLNQALVQRQLSSGVPLMAQLDAKKSDVLDIWIHGPALTMLKGPKDQLMASVEVTASTFDAAGKLLTAQTVAVTPPISPEQLPLLQADGLSQNIQFPRTAAAKRVRLAIRDVPSGRIGTVDVPLP